ncbi:MAG: hypothetical protein JW818_04285 [Pirellulales bacterium]|nr:hypothetical protein [Pirellulales bacterium]
MSETEPVAVKTRPQKSWCRRNWWRVLLLVLFVIIVGGGIGGYYYWRTNYGDLRDSEPCRMAFEAAAKEPRVIEQLGEPITLGWLPEGGENHFNVKLNGPRGQANMTVDARMFENGWGLQRLEVIFIEVENSQPITIDTAGDGLDDAPPWQP